MYRLRRIGYSLYYHVKDLLHRAGCNTIQDGDQANLYRTDVPYVVNVYYGYDDVELHDTDLPAIVIFHDLSRNTPLQIGGGWYDYSSFYIDVYGLRDSERDDLGSIIFEGLIDRPTSVYNYESSWPDFIYSSGEGRIVENYASGAPPAESDMWFEQVYYDTIPRLGTVGEVDNHRAVISLTAVTLR